MKYYFILDKSKQKLLFFIFFIFTVIVKAKNQGNEDSLGHMSFHAEIKTIIKLKNLSNSLI